MEVQESYYLQTFLNHPRNNLILIEHEQTLHHLIETSKNEKIKRERTRGNDSLAKTPTICIDDYPRLTSYIARLVMR